MSSVIDGSGGNVSGGRWRNGRGAAVAVAVGLVVSLMGADLGHVVAGTAPPDPSPPTTVEDTSPTTVVAVAPELAVTDTTLAVAVDTTAPTRRQCRRRRRRRRRQRRRRQPPRRRRRSRCRPRSMSVRPRRLAARSLPIDETYSVTVVAVCDAGTTPAVDVTNTGTGAIRVTVGPSAMDLPAAAPCWHAPWPEIERGLADPHPTWNAVRLDTTVIFDTGTLDLPPSCPPPPIVPGAPAGHLVDAGRRLGVLELAAAGIRRRCGDHGVHDRVPGDRSGGLGPLRRCRRGDQPVSWSPDSSTARHTCSA